MRVLTEEETKLVSGGKFEGGGSSNNSSSSDSKMNCSSNGSTVHGGYCR